MSRQRENSFSENACWKLLKFQQYDLHFFFAFIKNKNSITGKHAVFAIKGGKLEGKTSSY